MGLRTYTDEYRLIVRMYVVRTYVGVKDYTTIVAFLPRQIYSQLPSWLSPLASSFPQFDNDIEYARECTAATCVYVTPIALDQYLKKEEKNFI